MKFMFVKMFEQAAMEEGQIRTLFVVFAGGLGAISVIFALLQWHAWRRRHDLGLDALERLQTKQTLLHHNAMLLISLASATLAEIVPASWVGRTGLFYFVIPVYYFISGSIFGRQLRRLAKR
jgi:hypothetical protein